MRCQERINKILTGKQEFIKNSKKGYKEKIKELKMR
jgi:hypothetical protein